MSKFKVGDKVVRVSETYGKAIKEVYEVSGVSDKGCFGNWGINLKGHEVSLITKQVVLNLYVSP